MISCMLHSFVGLGDLSGNKPFLGKQLLCFQQVNVLGLACYLLRELFAITCFELTDRE